MIVLKGAPGAGKSTTAKLLAQHFPSGVRIEVDTLRHMVVSVDWTNQTEHRALLKLSAQLAAGFLRSEFSPVILVDTFSGDKIEGFLSEFSAHCPGCRVCVFVLHASDDGIRNRLLSREADGFRDVDIALAINRESVSNARPFEQVLDTGTVPPEEIAVVIRRCLCSSHGA